MMSDVSDAAVIKTSLANPQVFSEIFDRHFDRVHAYLYRRVGQDMADELAGDVFRVAFERRTQFDPSFPSAAPWLYGIAGRHVWRWFRTSDRRNRAYQRLAGRKERYVDLFDDVDDRLVAADWEDEIDRALRALNVIDRETLLLHAWESLTHEEIAMATQVPIGTVKSRLFRARRQMRERLGHSGKLLDEHPDGGSRHG